MVHFDNISDLPMEVDMPAPVEQQDLQQASPGEKLFLIPVSGGLKTKLGFPLKVSLSSMFCKHITYIWSLGTELEGEKVKLEDEKLKPDKNVDPKEATNVEKSEGEFVVLSL